MCCLHLEGRSVECGDGMFLWNVYLPNCSVIRLTYLLTYYYYYYYCYYFYLFFFFWRACYSSLGCLSHPLLQTPLFCHWSSSRPLLCMSFSTCFVQSSGGLPLLSLQGGCIKLQTLGNSEIGFLWNFHFNQLLCTLHKSLPTAVDRHKLKLYKLSYNCYTGAHSGYYSVVLWCLSLGVKQPEHESPLSPPCSVKVGNVSSWWGA